MKILVLLESPGKVAKISQILNSLKDGNSYTVRSTMGHISRIEDSGKYKTGIDFKTFEETYELLKEKEELVSKIKKEIKNFDLVYACSDNDREGEAISYHWKNFLSIPKTKYRRVVFKEITEKGVKDGLLNIKNSYDENEVESARTRAELDKIIGYRISPLSKNKIGAASAGRVQSAALKIICDRQREIDNFKPEKFYELYLNLSKDRKKLKAIYKGTSKEKVSKESTKTFFETAIKECEGKKYTISKIIDKEKFISPKDAFTTSTLQQAASTVLGFSPKRTMQIAQTLYENGLISYMRTDSVRLSEEFIEETKNYVINTYGKDYYKGFSSTKKGDQDGHEAIRPIHLNSDISTLDPAQTKLYKLIFNRTVASLMSRAKTLVTEVSILNGEHLFTLSGRTILFEGFMKLYSDEDEEASIPTFIINEEIKDAVLELVEKETQPPNRYSEAGLIKVLETSGIGRPSTFAPTVETLKSRKYITVEKKVITPTKLGMNLSEMLDEYFSKFINTKYTASMEEMLDKVAKGETNRVSELKNFFEEFNPIVIKAQKEINSEKEPVKMTNEICPQCGGHLVERKSRTTDKVFLACGRFPKCRYTKSLEEKKTEAQIPCPKCMKGFLVRKKSKKGTFFWGCSAWSETKCDCIISETDYKKQYGDPNFNDISSDNE